MNRLRIGEELLPANGPGSGDLNAFGHPDGDGSLPMDRQSQLVITADPQLALEGPDVGNAVAEVHASTINPFRVFGNIQRGM